MKKILILALILAIGGVAPAFAADINAAQIVQIDQSGTRSNVKITSGVVDTVSEVAHITNMDSLDAVESVNLGTFTLKDATTGAKAKVFADGAVSVKSAAEAGDSKSSYFVSVAVAANTEIDAGTYTVTAGKTYYLNVASIVASGLATVRVMSGTVEILRVMTTPSCQTAILPVYQAINVAAGITITLKVKNREASAMDITCLLAGSEK